MAVPVNDPWVVLPAERLKYEEQFNTLKPIGGYITGKQARDFFIQSQLPVAVLGQIWTLADTDGDGRMDKMEFAIAMKLIQLRLKGMEVPPILPPSMKSSLAVFATAGFGAPPVPVLPGTIPHSVPPVLPGPVSMHSIPSANSSSPIPGAVPNQDTGVGTAGQMGSPLQEWAVPHSNKLKYTQLFNTHDRARSGFLSGPQARNIMVQTGLPQPILAQIWALSDLDGDGRLSCEEFCVAMHLCDCVKAGDKLPAVLPPELIPPSFRKKRSPSIGGTVPAVVPVTAASVPVQNVGILPPPNLADLNLSDAKDDLKLAAGLATFEDKRRENFEKGQAELERRRQALLKSQRKEQEERERKEREEQERRERIRQEQERRRQMELEKQLAKQREVEQEREEQRRKQMEQREAARREMERQRQLEWEKQRRQELISLRQKEQEKVLHLKAKNQNLSIELEQLNEKVKELNSKISETRSGVADVKGSIDGMRVTRDKKVSELDELKHKIREQDQRLVQLTHEKQTLGEQIKMSAVNNPTAEAYNVVMHSFNNKHITLKNLRDKLATTEGDVVQKLQDINNNNNQLEDLKRQLQKLVNEATDLFNTYNEKRDKILSLRQEKGLDSAPPAPQTNNGFENAFAENSAWDDTAASNAWPTDTAEDAFAAKVATPPVTAASVWGSDDAWAAPTAASTTGEGATDADWGLDDNWVNSDNAAQPTALANGFIRYRAIYAFEARTEDELAIMPGDVVVVDCSLQSSEPGWLSGELHGRVGWFPEAYVEKMDAESANFEPEKRITSPTSPTQAGETVHIVGTEIKMTLSGIQEAPETTSDSGSYTEVAAPVPEPVIGSAFTQVAPSVTMTTSPVPGQGQSVEGLQAQAQFPWRAKKENHLTFNKGDIIVVKEQQDMWWFGEINGRQGWFPKSYVKLIAGPKRGEGSPEEISAEAVSAFDAAASEEALSAEQPEYYMALYSYQSTESGDLTFSQNDMILVIKKEGDWWTGTTEDRTGIFPSNYVKKLEDQPAVQEEPVTEEPLNGVMMSESPVTVNPVPSVSPSLVKGGKKLEVATVIAPYEATGPEQLSLQRGQLIQIRKKSPSGWWEGELQAKGKKRQIGWFPASYVRVLSSGGSARSTPDITQGSKDDYKSDKDQVRAMYAYTAQNEDELSFQKGDVINVVNREDPAWWRGEINGREGVFPANYTQAVGDADPAATAPWVAGIQALANLSPVERKRQGHISELISTEQSYMDDMSIVLDAFRRPLQESALLTPQELETIFVNWNELINCNTKLLKALRVRRKMSHHGFIHTIGDILCENLPHLTAYIRFCSCQLNAANIIQKKCETNPEFKALCKQCCLDPRTKGMPLSSFLLKPMQRITKYPLLIQKILEHTPENHPDRNNTEDALARAEELCAQVNEGVRERENSDRLEWIQRHIQCDALPEKITFNSLTNSLGPRKIVHFGIFYKAKSNKELLAFLFNDFLLLTTSHKSLNGLTSIFSNEKNNLHLKIYKQPIFLSDVLIKAGEDDDVVHFQLHHLDGTLAFKTGTAGERNTWVKKLEEASFHCQDTLRKRKEKILSDQAQQKAVVGRLLVVVIEGVGLKAKQDGRSDPYCEVSMGSQEHRSKVIIDTLNPRWNATMQFIIKDLREDVLCITVFDRDYFSPNDFLGRTEVRVGDIYHETKDTYGPIVKRLPLYEVESGEVVLKLDIQLFQQLNHIW